MQAYFRNQSLLEPGQVGVVSGESATGNGHIPPTAPCLRTFPEGGADPSASRRACTKGLTPQPTDLSAPLKGTEEMVAALKRPHPPVRADKIYALCKEVLI